MRYLDVTKSCNTCKIYMGVDNHLAALKAEVKLVLNKICELEDEAS